MKKSIVFQYKFRNFEKRERTQKQKINIMETRAILDFFEENNCKVKMYLIGCYMHFDIFSNDHQTWVLTDANEFMLKGFYLKCIKN